MKKRGHYWKMRIFLTCLWLLTTTIGLQPITAADNVEVVKAVTPDELNNGDGDQVALESIDQDGGSPTIHHPHQQPSSGISRVNLAIGQPFGPPPPHQMAYHGPPPPLPPGPQIHHNNNNNIHLQLPSSSSSSSHHQHHHNGPHDQTLSSQSSSLPSSLASHHDNEIINEKIFALPSVNSNELWALPVTDMPKIISLDVKCEKNGMKVFLQFDKPFFGIVFSKGHYSNINCVHLPAGLGRSSVTFEIGLHACGTAGNTENGLYGYGSDSGSGTYFENIVVIQYDPQVQEVWDQARKLRCTWHDQYEKSVTFRPFPVDMLDVVRADFAGDNVGCWMQIQVGKGPWASEVSGLVKIGQTMTMVLAIKDDDSKFDMLVRNCMAHDGKRAPIQLVDQRGCITRPKLMSRFTKIKNFGASASVLSYAHFQAFKFPDSMEVHFQCTIQICRYQCPEQCSDTGLLDVHHLSAGPELQYGPPPPPPQPLLLQQQSAQHLPSIGLPHQPPPQHQIPLEAYLHGGHGHGHGNGHGQGNVHGHGHGHGGLRDDRRRRSRSTGDENPEKEVGLNRVIKVVSSGDLTFSIDDQNSNLTQATTMIFPMRDDGLICMTTPGLAITLIILLGILIVSCLMSAFLCIRLRPFSFSKKDKDLSHYGGGTGATAAHHATISTIKQVVMPPPSTAQQQQQQQQPQSLSISATVVQPTQKRKYSIYS